jgi:hypothetical protein
VSELYDDDDYGPRGEETAAEPQPVEDSDETLEDILKPWSLEDFRLPPDILDVDGSIDTDDDFGRSRRS